ncbi:hypothetical protein Q3G72_002119 [Acer saccharum]|nr:hypothetical protein Q3G72_002119 [Acer saccharum]
MLTKARKHWIRKSRSKAIPCQNRNAKLVIDRNLIQGTNRGLVRDSSSSSSDSERSWGAFSEFNLMQGEDLISEEQVGQPNREHKAQDEFSLEDHSSSTSGCRISKGINATRNHIPCVSSKSSDSNSLAQNDTQAEILPKTPNKRKEGKKCLSTKSHAMKTRNSKALSSRSMDVMDKGVNSNKFLNLEVEITKVIEKGVALGVNFNKSREEAEKGRSIPNQEAEVDRLRSLWNLEKEIT